MRTSPTPKATTGRSRGPPGGTTRLPRRPGAPPASRPTPNPGEPPGQLPLTGRNQRGMHSGLVQASQTAGTYMVSAQRPGQRGDLTSPLTRGTDHHAYAFTTTSPKRADPHPGRGLSPSWPAATRFIPNEQATPPVSPGPGAERAVRGTGPRRPATTGRPSSSHHLDTGTGHRPRPRHGSPGFMAAALS